MRESGRESGSEVGGSRSPVDHWETLEVLFNAQVEVGKEILSLVVEVQRPIFEGGRAGRPSMGCILRRGERMLRLPCRDGSTAEIIAFRSLLAGLDADTLIALTERYWALRDKHSETDQQVRRAPKPGEVGGGLSRYSKTPKRDRRESKNGSEDRRRREGNGH